jgi:hypothetical protein
MPKDNQEVEDIVEHVAEVCDSVEFLHGVPVKLPSETKALLRGRIREALTTYGNARELKGVEKVEALVISKHYAYMAPLTERRFLSDTAKVKSEIK